VRTGLRSLWASPWRLHSSGAVGAAHLVLRSRATASSQATYFEYDRVVKLAGNVNPYPRKDSRLSLAPQLLKASAPAFDALCVASDIPACD
jgi:hypothetical protein